MRWLSITIFIASYRVPATSIIFMILYIYSLWIGLATAAAWSWAGQTQLAAGSWLSCSCDCQTVYFLNSAGLGSEEASWGIFSVSSSCHHPDIRLILELPRYHNRRRTDCVALAHIQRWYTWSHICYLCIHFIFRYDWLRCDVANRISYSVNIMIF